MGGWKAGILEKRDRNWETGRKELRTREEEIQKNGDRNWETGRQKVKSCGRNSIKARHEFRNCAAGIWKPHSNFPLSDFLVLAPQYPRSCVLVS